MAPPTGRGDTPGNARVAHIRDGVIAFLGGIAGFVIGWNWGGNILGWLT